MKVGLSTYSLVDLIRDKKQMTVLDALDWIAANGGEHAEIVPFGFDLVDNDDLIQKIKSKAKELNLDLSAYSILANLIPETQEEYKAEIERVKQHVLIAQKLGVKYMRHDISAFFRSAEINRISNFEKDFPRMVQACQEITNFAKQHGIITTVENHGFFVNGSDRIEKLLLAVNDDNFKLTLDIGNFMCVDENPIVGLKKILPYATMIHLKDFYLRSGDVDMGEGYWFRTNVGDYLRGAIFGHGDMDVRKALKLIKESGYKGYASLEFEGMEDCRLGSRIGMDNIKRIWDEV